MDAAVLKPWRSVLLHSALAEGTHKIPEQGHLKQKPFTEIVISVVHSKAQAW